MMLRMHTKITDPWTMVFWIYGKNAEIFYSRQSEYMDIYVYKYIVACRQKGQKSRPLIGNGCNKNVYFHGKVIPAANAFPRQWRDNERFVV
jgi:hypothetical protein